MQPFAPRLNPSSIKRATVAAILLMASCVSWADDISDVQKLMSTGKTADALQRADQFLASKPRDPMMRFLRGLSLSQLGRTPEAITAFTKLTEDYPELPEPFNNLAVLYAQQGQYEKARAALEMAIRTNPSYATAYENLGDVYAKLASQAYSKALQIDTRSAVAPKLAMIRDIFPQERNTVLAAAAPTPNTTAPAIVPVASTSGATSPATPTPVQPASVAIAPAPKTEPAKVTKPDAAPTTVEREVENALQAWAKAWARKDMNDYYAAYTKDFDGGKANRREWEEERRSRITSKREIAVKLSDVRVQIVGDRAVVNFRQAYKADALNVSSRKAIEMTRVGGKWLIAKESTGS